MLENQNIICFGSAHWGYPGLQQTVMKRLSAQNRILFFNSIGTRRIALNYAFFLAAVRRMAGLVEKKSAARGNLSVHNPWSIPLSYNAVVSSINTALIRKQCLKLTRKLQFFPYILWIGSPMMDSLPDGLEPALTVYNPVDRYHAFSFVDYDNILSRQQKIAGKADLILCTSEAIRNDLLPYNGNIYNVSHGVDFGHFNSSFVNAPVPEDIKSLKRPIIGYFGGLSERVDYGVISELANAQRDASIVLIGEQRTGLRRIEGYTNIFLLGRKSFSILPQYLNEFDVCLIPYHVNELMEGVDPIKLKEYFCLGKPVVSTDLPEVRKYDPLVYIGKDPLDFVQKVSLALAEDSPVLREERIQTARKSDWSVKMEEISEIVQRSLDLNRIYKGIPDLKSFAHKTGSEVN